MTSDHPPPHDRSEPPGARAAAIAPARIEPEFGRWRELRFERDRAPRPPPARPWFGWGAAGAVMLVLLALVWLRQPLSDRLWPDSRLQQLRSDAAQALREGRLSSPDGRGARELYEAALALDPDRDEARAGLTRVGQAALVQAERAIAQRRYAQAHAHLNLAAELAVPRAQAEALERRLREREAADAGLDRLLAQAASARAAGHLDDGDHAALPLYQRVLALQPKRIEALEGREDTLADLLQQARRALAGGDLLAGAARIRRVQSADPGHAELPDALTDLARRADVRRGHADGALRRGRLPEAAESYRELLAAIPDDAAAQRGLGAVAAAYAQRSERLAADFRFDEAAVALRDAEAIAPATAAVTDARAHLERARQSRKRFGGELPPAQRQQRLRRLLEEAAAAEARGQLLAPPGDSAYDKLRAAQALAPQDPKVRAAAARLLPAARRCFEDELRGNRLGRAGECLDARRALEGEGAAVAEARRRLALRWLAVGDERLGAGELHAAQAALKAARELDPAATGIDDLADRVRAAGAGRD
ncbi:hypothetical protein LVB77_05870 [Lysobacter sp. 5GHs7-4]|uniref:hypothetical protein n=1 Tax=Lysobacter sp. 5GHs7-4 TaxID=2904253 RepID=UPI001E2922D3|nr:hypothetical protein [Lysobacter sp. 5GHs7-4]UHQ24226.1 hypothetical protein LVB77_05870 [Lysobacter sp. 5GHs7-4]